MTKSFAQCQGSSVRLCPNETAYVWTWVGDARVPPIGRTFGMCVLHTAARRQQFGEDINWIGKEFPFTIRTRTQEEKAHDHHTGADSGSAEQVGGT